jgi:hypothetical protein
MRTNLLISVCKYSRIEANSNGAFGLTGAAPVAPVPPLVLSTRGGWGGVMRDLARRTLGGRAQSNAAGNPRHPSARSDRLEAGVTVAAMRW